MDALQKLTYGYYILSSLKKAEELKTRENDYMAAGLVNWASQISFDPEMIMVAVEKQSELNETIDYSESFTLHLLDEDHDDILESFAKDSTFQNGKLNGMDYSNKNDYLHIDELNTRIDCQVESSVNVGDHTIYFGKVVSKSAGDKPALCTREGEIRYTKMATS